MSNLRNLWNRPSDWAKGVGTRRMQRQQYQAADNTELQALTPDAPPPAYRSTYDDQDDTEYRPHETLGNISSIEAAHEDRDVKKQPVWRNKRYTQGWRFGVVNGAMSASLVFLINLIASIYAGSHDRGVLMKDDCSKIHSINTGLHLLINLLSTILLASSNYCMQCLSAPTRSEIDAAHAKGNWLDIGVPSTRNLRFISRKRILLWLALGLSSLPLHLFYNSVVFGSIASNDYLALSVSESFVTNEECVGCQPTDSSYMDLWSSTLISLHQSARNSTLKRFNNSDCISEYAKMIQSNLRHVLIVSTDDHYGNKTSTDAEFNGTYVYHYQSVSASQAENAATAQNTFQWICTDYGFGTYSDQCGNILGRITASNWTVYNVPVAYCLSEEKPPVCRLQFNVGIAALVTVLNICKALIIFYTAFRVQESPLMTMGDAVASFMEKEDPTTRNMCLLTMADAKAHKGYFPAGSKVWNGDVKRWKDVTSKTRRATTLSMFVAALILVGSLLGVGIDALQGDRSIPALIKLGYGVVDPRTIISWTLRGTVQNIIIANLAQPILSFLYFSYNGLFTCMLMGYEWSQYAYTRKGLRVSRSPHGKQRSTYFLQLPYRFALPLMVLSGILHWLVSQSIFLVAIDTYDWDVSSAYADSDMESFYTCGYSPIAIISVLFFGVLMVIAGIGFGYLKYKPGINLAGSCSAAISATCHGAEYDGISGMEAVGEKVQWGVVGIKEAGVGHCAFSSAEVEFPKEGSMYAGEVRDRRRRGESVGSHGHLYE